MPSSLKLAILKHLRDRLELQFPSLVRHAYTLETAYDLLILYLVHDFYNVSQKDSNFEEFCSNYKIDDLLAKADIKTRLSLFSKSVEEKESFWNKTVNSGFEIVGDFHSPVTKIKSENSIYSESFLGVEKYFNYVFNEIVPMFSKLIPRVEIFPEYIKREYVEYDDDNFNPQLYYKNFGLLLSVAMFFRLADLHMENVVLNNNWLVMFDYEFPFSPDYDHLLYSIRPSHLVSHKMDDNVSALLGGYTTIYSYLKPILVEEDGLPQIIWKKPSNRAIYNCPSVKTRTGHHPVEYINYISDGFELGTQELIRNKNKILEYTNDSNIKVRQLVRPTKQYRYLTVSYGYPQINQKYSFDKHYDRVFKRTQWKDFFEPRPDVLKRLEIEDCYGFGVPFYYSNLKECGVYHSSGELVGMMKESPLEAFSKHIADENYKVFAKKQLALTKRFITLHHKKLSLTQV